LLGGGIGLALAATALRVGVGLLPETLPRVREIGLDWHAVLVKAPEVAIVPCVATGPAPGLGSAGTLHPRLLIEFVSIENQGFSFGVVTNFSMSSADKQSCLLGLAFANTLPETLASHPERHP
jgi:hypothetical protein